MLDRFTGMQVFAKVAAQGSFSGAARSLGLSQTMVTKHIAALESRLGISLFHRSTRRLSLTEPGRLFSSAARKSLRIWKRWNRKSRRKTRSRAGCCA